MSALLPSLPAYAVVLGALAYAAFALSRVGRRRDGSGPAPRPPISVLKPVCGLDDGLYGNLRSFCEQDYPDHEVLFCAAREEDPAVAVVRRLLSDLPGRNLRLVIGGGTAGANAKASNLANAVPQARHDIIVVADSDMRVGPDYLACVAVPFADPEVGAATCLYKGTGSANLPSRLGAMFINDRFLPSVLVALELEELRYCFGATMAVRRVALEAFGGFATLSAYLADDYMLGKLVTERGWRVALAPYVVENRVHEPDLASLLRHELRWDRTVRTVRPWGHALSFITHTIPVALLGLAGESPSAAGLALLAAAVGLRVLTHRRVHAALGLPGHPTSWLVPLRDLLCFAVWIASFAGRRVHWHAQAFDVAADGRMTLKTVPGP